MEFVIITGLSGAGKSQAVKILEDMSYYCMDNLPPALLPNFAELCSESKKLVDKAAVVVDIRGGIFFDDLFRSLEILKDRGLKYSILYLDATDETLVKRYKELRRPHPLNVNGRIIDGIAAERKKLKEVKQKANYIIDTSNINLGRLKEEIRGIFTEGKITHNLTLSIISFGYKYGIPNDADLVFDVRFLPNPHYVKELRPMTGNNKEVREYVMKNEISQIFFNKLVDMLEFLLPNYLKEGKSQLVVAIGCTGGRHRSVTIVNGLADFFGEKNYRVLVSHRDDKK